MRLLVSQQDSPRSCPLLPLQVNLQVHLAGNQQASLRCILQDNRRVNPQRSRLDSLQVNPRRSRLDSLLASHRSNLVQDLLWLLLDNPLVSPAANQQGNRR